MRGPQVQEQGVLRGAAGMPDPLVSAAELGIDASGEIAALHARLDRLRGGLAVQAVADLSAAQIATLAGLRRPEPMDGVRLALAGEELDEYLLLTRSALFDPNWYRRTYPDVVAGARDPALHYLRHGWREGRQPGPAFDGANYLIANPDVARAGMNPLVHYHRYGMAAQRPLTPQRVSDQGPSRFVRNDDPLCIVADLRSLDEYLAFQLSCPLAFSDEAERKVLTHVETHGTQTDFSGYSGPEQTIVEGTDLREHLISAGMTSRGRAVCDAILEALRTAGLSDDDARVYGHEAITDFAKTLRRRFNRYVGTEYAPTEEARRALFPALHNDVCDSRFEDCLFDVTFSCDVLEHVPDLDAALRETARTLVPGGTFIATLPFDHDVATGWRFAEMRDGELVHLLGTPIYHGNPMDPAGGSLVFEIPGWDLVGRATAAGFSDAVMRFICDQKRGIVASPDNQGKRPRGVFLLVCTR
ncbi:MAG: class I SAM-dependent methyltransferase [Janthinobacterium lividum]